MKHESGFLDSVLTVNAKHEFWGYKNVAIKVVTQTSKETSQHSMILI